MKIRSLLQMSVATLLLSVCSASFAGVSVQSNGDINANNLGYTQCCHVVTVDRSNQNWGYEGWKGTKSFSGSDISTTIADVMATSGNTPVVGEWYKVIIEPKYGENHYILIQYSEQVDEISSYGYVRVEGDHVAEALVSNLTRNVFLSTTAVHQGSTCVGKIVSFPFTTQEVATVQGTIEGGVCSVAVSFDVLDTFDSDQVAINIQDQEGAEWHFKMIVER